MGLQQLAAWILAVLAVDHGKHSQATVLGNFASFHPWGLAGHCAPFEGIPGEVLLAAEIVISVGGTSLRNSKFHNKTVSNFFRNPKQVSLSK